MSHGEGHMKGRSDGLDLYSQAVKALSVRCPFEGEEAPRDPSLPSTLSSFLERHLDGRKNSHRKAEEPSDKPLLPPPPPPPPSDKTTIWDETEQYFRPITLPDIQYLLPKQFLDEVQLDSCFSVPSVGTSLQNVEKDTSSGTEAVAVTPQECSKFDQEIKNDAMDISPDTAPTPAPPMSEAVQQDAVQEEDASSLHWMLGSKDRFVLTSERPNKKHKLLGQEAGLERLLSLPQSGDEPCTSCDMCCNGETGVQSNKLLCCDACKVFVHQKCYGVHGVPEEPWLCLRCRNRDSISKQCVLCPKEGGVIKPAGNGLDMYVHLFCSLWAPEVYVANMKAMEPVLNLEGVPTMRKKLVCNVCKVKNGVCVRCSHGTCRAAFHPICARDSKHQMEIWGKSKNDSVEMRAFCSKHSTIVSPKVEPPAVILQQDQNVTPKKVPLLKFTRKNKDKNASASNELVNCSSPKLGKKETDIEPSKDANSNGDLDGAGPWMNSPDFDSGLRKFIDSGKITVSDLAAEVGISSESLEAALLGETTTFSPGLKMRIVKWLQNNNVEKEEPTNVSLDLQSPVVKSQPPRLRTKGSLVILKDDEEETDAKMTDATDAVATSLTEDTKEENMAKLLSTSDPTSMKEEVLLSEPIADHLIHNNQSFDSQQNVVLTDGAVSMDLNLLKNEDANVASRSLENGQCNSSGFTSASYVHLLIRRKLMDLKDGNSNQQSREENSHESDLSDAIEDELSKAKSSGILDLAPEDEVEGELVYLQSKLLDNSVNSKQRCEDLLENSLQSLPNEMDAVNRRKWDLIVVSQFLREVKDAKKRGRKERRHREAKAVMVEATAAAATSSRNAGLRKDSKDDTPTTTNKEELKIGTSTRAKDSTRTPPSKASASDKKSATVFQIPILSRDNTLVCDICSRSETVLNRIFVCSECKVNVHLDCYHSLKNPRGPWRCEVCEESPPKKTSPSTNNQLGDSGRLIVRCALCGNSSGAFRKTTDGLWVHAFCAEWMLESIFRRGQENLVEGLGILPMERDTCCICLCKTGSCSKCSYGDCRITFHPWCARGAGFYMNARGLGGVLQHRAYCAKHSTEQKEADDQQYGPEEIKCLKQTRVELEKLRLLCERIIKREKLKRDLVQCSNQILSKKKDCIISPGHIYARSGPTRSGPTKSGSFLPPGVSSESATTSINNRSSYNSRSIQQSDDGTVDSSVSHSRHNTVRFTLQNRETDDGTSPPLGSLKRKTVDRGSFAGKSVPKRAVIPTKISTQSVCDDGDMKPKLGQAGQTFQKELVMTSDQASAQNQRLPKGFAYVPIGSLSKEKPRDATASRDSEEPGG
ncbi:PHD finger family protein isoform X2 [Carex rostrata]